MSETVAEAMARRFNELYGQSYRGILPEQPTWEELGEQTRQRLVTIFTTLLRERRINPHLPADWTPPQAEETSTE
jgi:hypothetical protein